MKWNHLPVAGGLYDQHPQLLDEWQYIFSVKADKEKRDLEQQQRESKSKSR
jgi:hypothetical protein